MPDNIDSGIDQGIDQDATLAPEGGSGIQTSPQSTPGPVDWNIDGGIDQGIDQYGTNTSAPAVTSDAPDILGPVTVKVTSFPSAPMQWQAGWRVGDTQPVITIILLDGNNELIHLSTASSVSLIFVSAISGTIVQTSQMTVSADGESATYERQLTDPTTTTSGWYNMIVVAGYAGGTGFSAPTNGELFVLVKGATAG